jgi:hypothetical protein
MSLDLVCSNPNCRKTLTLNWPVEGQHVIVDAVEAVGWFIDAHDGADGFRAACSTDCRGEVGRTQQGAL